MTADEIEKLARDGKPLPKIHTLPDACFYESLAALWQRFRAGQIDRDQAHAQKMRLIRRYAEFNACYDTCCRYFRENQEHIRTAGTLLSEIEKASAAAEIAEIACKIIALYTGDSSFPERQMKKIWEENRNA